MTILNPENTEQEFIIIPRNYNGLNLTLLFTDEQTKETHTLTVLAVNITADWYDMVTFFVPINFLYENAFFELVIKSSTQEVIYKDKVFCTSQNLKTFSVNDGEYILPTINNNDYIVIQ